MIASELIKELKKLIDEHGDLEVFATNHEGCELISVTEVYMDNEPAYDLFDNKFEENIKICGSSIY